MDYSRTAREAVSAMKAVRDTDEMLWWDAVLVALADLFPTSALGFALHQPDVWPRLRRQALRSNGPPDVRSGFYLEDFITLAETAAAADGVRMVHEVHLARAFTEYDGAVQELGVSTSALIRRVAEREQRAIAAVAVPRQSRVVGTARAELLAERLTGRDLSILLDEEERSGILDRKRSILNTDDPTLADHEKVAVALVNGSPETPVYLIFGQEDKGGLVGEVDHRGAPLTPEVVLKCQRRLDSRLQACVPPVPLKWESVVRDGKTVWIACMLGRARGTAVRTSLGSYPYRSGEDTHYATPELITAWQREPAQGGEDAAALEASGPQQGMVDVGGQSDRLAPSDGLLQRQALSLLREAVTSLYAAPPSMPHSINGKSVSDWEPVTKPILEHFQSAMGAVVSAGLMANDEQLDRLMRGVRTVFRLPESRGGLTWIVDSPRLVCRLIADRLLVASYLSERWERIWLIGRPAFDSYEGRLPWVLAPEYRHPETVGRDATLANDLSLQTMKFEMRTLFDPGLTEGDVTGAYSAVSVALALGAIAREDATTRGGKHVAWAAILPGLGEQLEVWEEESRLVEVLALIAGEEASDFRARLPERLTNIVDAVNSSGWSGWISQAGWAAVQRIATS